MALLHYFFLSFVLSFTFLYYILRQKHWNKKIKSLSVTTTTPPSPSKLPIIGHLHLLTVMPHHAFAQLAHKLNTPIIHLQLGQVPTVVISSSQLAKLVLKTHDLVFANRPHLLSAQYIFFGCSDVTFSPYGHYWRQARKICVTELLTAKRVNSFQRVRAEEVNRLLTTVVTQCGSKTDMSKLFFTLSNDMLCRVAFGMRFLEGQKSNFTKVLMENQELLGGFGFGDFFPKWGWINLVSGYTRRLKKNLNDMSHICDEIIDEHLKKIEGKTLMDNGEDFVDVLLRVQRHDDLDVPITNDNLKALVLDMFIAGTDTTSTTLEWAMTELARHPRAMKKAQEEVRKVVSSSDKLEDHHIQQLYYLQAVMKETMRLHPPVPLLVPRESMKDCVLEGYEIPFKTRILINAYAIGRDPNSWENPLEFVPERFEENNIEFKDQDFKLLPFGGGRRGCPGSTFALATVEMALAQLLYQFDWALPDGVRADDIDLQEIFNLVTTKKSPLMLVPTANKDYELKANNA